MLKVQQNSPGGRGSKVTRGGIGTEEHTACWSLPMSSEVSWLKSEAAMTLLSEETSIRKEASYRSPTPTV